MWKKKEERKIYIYIDDSKIGSMPFFEKSLNFAEPYTNGCAVLCYVIYIMNRKIIKMSVFVRAKKFFLWQLK